jgi:ADP-ribosylglycohydrolase
MLGAIAGDIIGSVHEGARNAISLGGDADTMACIAGGIAEAYYGGVPDGIGDYALALLDDRLRAVVHEFIARFGRPRLPSRSA